MSKTVTETTMQTKEIFIQKPKPAPLQSGKEARLASRAGSFTTPTSGVAPTYLQANLIILPSRYAPDFRKLCARNPVPCPIIAESNSTGQWDAVKSYIPDLGGNTILQDCDIRHDAPRYNVYQDSRLVKKGCLNIETEWTEDHVAFLIGCSFSFEAALTEAGLVPRHTLLNRNVPMYRTTLPLAPSGVFTGGTYVVSMRPYARSDIDRVRSTTRPFLATHGEPIAWGWDAIAKLGIRDIDIPEWGDAPLTVDGLPLGETMGGEEIPVFWGCGVTPQEAVMRAGLEGTIMSHAPGHMLMLDCRDQDIIKS
ncbi:DUF1445 domain-containing protein [Pyrenochaeta sp. DS3sAY3a]|nr:DUF1445 domain-containing protein [Pyrenochaeta sp. DS3sAY3a]